MIRFFLKRLFWAIPTLWVILTLTFLFLRLVPGGPFDRDRELPPEIKANIARRYGLDQPLAVQYGRYLRGFLRGDFGPSLKYLGRGTREIIAETLPVSVALGGIALLMALFLGLPLGILAGASRFHQSRSLILGDRLTLFLTSTGISIPNFVFAALLIFIFSFRLRILPPALWEGPAYVLMPALTLAVYPAAYIARLIRVSLLEVLSSDYILTARAKGVSDRLIVLKHALKNSLSSVVSILGPLTASLITGSFIVEYLFAIPGMGGFFVTAVTNRDYPLVLGITFVYATLVILMNILVDLSYVLLDPRVKLESS